MYRYNPPPNWPEPPPGWRPPDGWRPQAEWGPAPDGWDFWIQDDAAAPVDANASDAAADAPTSSFEDDAPAADRLTALGPPGVPTLAGADSPLPRVGMPVGAGAPSGAPAPPPRETRPNRDAWKRAGMLGIIAGVGFDLVVALFSDNPARAFGAGVGTALLAFLLTAVIAWFSHRRWGWPAYIGVFLGFWLVFLVISSIAQRSGSGG